MTSHNHSGLVRVQMDDYANTCMEESATVWTDILDTVWQSTSALALHAALFIITWLVHWFL